MELDTHPAEIARYFDLLRALSPAQRLRAASAASRRVRTFAVAGIRQRFPDADEAEIRFRLAELLYGLDVAQRHFGKTPSP
ncbi:MAG: hypothetical protein QM765_27400 [Myxococcales bacterium]